MSGAAASTTAPVSTTIATSGNSPAVVLYHAVDHESPVRADPDDLLLLPGSGVSAQDTVVYRAVTDTTQSVTASTEIPTANTANAGTADLVSTTDAPHALTVHLPAAAQRDQSYAVWVVDSNGQWSDSVLINDARPLWITPDEAYVSAATTGLPRSLKVVGRNLQPAPGATTQVRLVGPETYTLSTSQSSSDAALNRYVAAVQLPVRLAAGTYSVQVSRDGTSWVPLPGQSGNPAQTLTVVPDAAPQTRFAVGSYTFGSCTPTHNNCTAVKESCLPDATDGNDATLCVVAAIAGAAAAGGGTVVFGPGAWNMHDPGTWSSGATLSNKGVTSDGILVPDGVSLEGAGSGSTTVARGTSWGCLAVFSLFGHATISGFTFSDQQIYQGLTGYNEFLQFGVMAAHANTYGVTIGSVSHVVIAQNVFSKPFIAIGNLYSGIAVDHLVVASNIFGAYATAIQFEGDATNSTHPYQLRDSIIDSNTFYPGSYLDVTAAQGTIATQLSGGYHTDFSNNVADGTSTAYLQNPSTDVRGWRAAFFWSMDGNIEMALVSKNKATCTGDKDGDGEGIAFDNNHNRTGFQKVAVGVLSASGTSPGSTSTVTVSDSLLASASSWIGTWVQVVQGTGLGQARKIVAVSTSAQGGTTLAVAPAFDVLPDSSSQVAVGEVYWQVYTVANAISNAAPCSASNLTPQRQTAGVIDMYAQMVDSATEGNSQTNTGGILLYNIFAQIDPSLQILAPGSSIQSSNEVRSNEITGAFGSGSGATAGITLSLSATRDTAPPPVLSFAVAISHNTVTAAGGQMGAVSLSPGWYVGPTSATAGAANWQMTDSTLIFDNTLTDVGLSGSKTVGIGQSAAAAPGQAIEWRTVLYGNVCNGRRPTSLVVDHGARTARYCPSVPSNSCECGS
jgi:hypothetical protein